MQPERHATEIHSLGKVGSVWVVDRTLHGFPYVLKVSGGGRCGQDKELKVCPVFRRCLTSQVCSPGPGEVTKI